MSRGDISVAALKMLNKGDIIYICDQSAIEFSQTLEYPVSLQALLTF
jgi:hypothetical protein